MLTYLTVIFKNYNLLDYQRLIFSKYNIKNTLVIVDNTPIQDRQTIIPLDNEIIIYRDNFGGEFDGISHGEALDLGIQHINTKFVCIFDSDFFLYKNPESYIYSKFDSGFVAIGAEFWNEDTLGCFTQHKTLYKNIPCCFCGFYELSIIKDLSWVITQSEIDFSTSYIEVGWRIRKFLIDNNHKTYGWACVSENNMFSYYDENSELIGKHLVAGSHRNINFDLATL